MPAKMERTKTPGVYKRGGRYVVTYRDGDGKAHKKSCRTYDDARKLKRQLGAAVDAGELHVASRQTLHDYAREWVERYQGGRRGFREQTRDDYRRLLELYALAYFPARMKLTEVRPVHIARFIQWLCDGRAQAVHAYELAVAGHADAVRAARERGGRTPRPPAPLADDAVKFLSDKTIRNILCPLRACLGTARREGTLTHNPVDGAQLPNRPTIDEDDEDTDARVLTREQLATFLLVVHPRHQLFFRVLASTGLRVSEAIALQWRHIHLDGSKPHVKVRRGIVRGRLGPPKSKHARREVPLSPALVDALRAWRHETEWPDAEHLVFPSTNGKPLHTSNLRRRVLKPAAEEAGAPWAGFHTCRHTCASLLFDRGANAVQVQHWLGHHSAAFTLSTYVHLLDGDLGEPLELPVSAPTFATLSAVEQDAWRVAVVGSDVR